MGSDGTGIRHEHLSDAELMSLAWLDAASVSARELQAKAEGCGRCMTEAASWTRMRELEQFAEDESAVSPRLVADAVKTALRRGKPRRWVRAAAIAAAAVVVLAGYGASQMLPAPQLAHRNTPAPPASPCYVICPVMTAPLPVPGRPVTSAQGAKAAALRDLVDTGIATTAAAPSTLGVLETTSPLNLAAGVRAFGPTTKVWMVLVQGTFGVRTASGVVPANWAVLVIDGQTGLTVYKMSGTGSVPLAVNALAVKLTAKAA